MFSQRMYGPVLPRHFSDSMILRKSRPYEADKGCQVGGAQGNRGIPTAEGGRIQEVRDRGENWPLYLAKWAHLVALVVQSGRLTYCFQQ